MNPALAVAKPMREFWDIGILGKPKVITGTISQGPVNEPSGSESGVAQNGGGPGQARWWSGKGPDRRKKIGPTPIRRRRWDQKFADRSADARTCGSLAPVVN